MGETRVQRGIRNVRWGILFQCVSMAANFVLRTVLIRILGMEASGLGSVFEEIVSILSIVETGVRTAMTYRFYAPLAQKDFKTIRRLMGLYGRIYRVLGAGMFTLGVSLTPLINRLARNETFSLNDVRAAFLLYIIQASVSCLFAHRRALLSADQRSDVIYRICTLVALGRMSAGIAMLFLGRGYIAYVAVQVMCTLGCDAAVAWRAGREYPFLHSSAPIALTGEKEQALKSAQSLLVSALSGKMTTSTDSVLISALAGTYKTGIYSNYALIGASIRRIFTKSCDALAGSLGNLFASEDGTALEAAYTQLEFLFGALGMIAALGLYAVATPFVRLWIGNEGVIGSGALAIMAINEFLFAAREPLWRAYMVSGLFVLDKYISVLGSAVNLIVSLVLGRRWGIEGILLGTTCTLIIQIVLKEWMLYRRRFGRTALKALGCWTARGALLLAGIWLLNGIHNGLEEYGAFIQLALNGGCALLSGVGMIYIVFRRTAVFAQSKALVGQLLMNRRTSAEGAQRWKR